MPHKNPEDRRAYAATYRATHHLQFLARDKAYKAAHHQAILARKAAYRLANKDKIRVSNAQYRATHQTQIRERTAAYAATRRAATKGDTLAIKAIYRRARENRHLVCYLCGKPIPRGDRHVDHIIPLSKAGAHTPANLAITHKHCNINKRDKTPQQLGFLF
jgi:5-methylcytosine-specific restriction endonuclease McrA